MPLSTLDSSMPALAQTKPCLVSQIMKSGPTLTISLDSSIIASTSLTSFPVNLASSWAFFPGSIVFRLIIFPSALATAVSAITRISPSSTSKF